MKALYYFGLATLTFCCGCSSLLTRNVNNDPWGAYPGVRMDAGFIAHPTVIAPELSGNPPLIWTLATLDFPFSAVMDTLLLPIDLTFYMPKSSKHTKWPNTALEPTPWVSLGSCEASGWCCLFVRRGSAFGR